MSRAHSQGRSMYAGRSSHRTPSSARSCARELCQKSSRSGGQLPQMPKSQDKFSPTSVGCSWTTDYATRRKNKTSALRGLFVSTLEDIQGSSVSLRLLVEDG